MTINDRFQVTKWHHHREYTWSGHHAVVHEGESLADGKLVALKTVREDVAPGSVQYQTIEPMFELEAAALRRLGDRYANNNPANGLIEDGLLLDESGIKRRCLVLEFLQPKQNIAYLFNEGFHFIGSPGVLLLPEALWLARSAALAYDLLSDVGLTYSDPKLIHFYREGEGKSLRIRMADFNIVELSHDGGPLSADQRGRALFSLVKRLIFPIICNFPVREQSSATDSFPVWPLSMGPTARYLPKAVKDLLQYALSHGHGGQAFQSGKALAEEIEKVLSELGLPPKPINLVERIPERGWHILVPKQILNRPRYDADWSELARGFTYLMHGDNPTALDVIRQAQLNYPPGDSRNREAERLIAQLNGRTTGRPPNGY